MSAVSAPLLHMDTLLTPHRSLPKRGLVLLLCGLAAYNVLVAIFLLAIGAFPVPIFLGVDFLAVIIAFRASYRSAGRAERVQVTADQVRVFLEQKGGAKPLWTSPTAFTRVSLDANGRYGARVRLHMSNKSLTVAGGLGPKQRRAFAADLRQAIQSAKSERYAPEAP